MYILKNAITSITRNKGRNILIGIIIMIISASVAVTLAINNTASSLIKSYKEKFQVEATISINRENMMKDFNPEDKESSKSNMKEMFSLANNISVSDIEKYADSKYVKSYYYTQTVGVNANIEKAEMTSNSNNDMMDKRKDNNDDNKEGETTTDFNLKGYSSYDAMSEFVSGNYKVTDGEVFEDFDSNNCLINSELATLNNLKVGDTITVTDTASNIYDLVISGIYEEKEDTDSGMKMFANSANTIITSSNFISKMSETNQDLAVTTSPTFILTSSAVVDKFSSELTSKGLNENLTVQTNLDQVENATSTISNVKTFAVTFLIITLIIGAVVLLIINMINIRERKYEIGVLRTIGMKKSKVCLQFVLELLIVAFASLLLGAFTGAMVSVPVSNSLLKNEITASQESSNNIQENFGHGGNKQNDRKFNGVANVEAFDSIDATVDMKVLLELLGIGLSLTLISSLSAILSIEKFSPLTILKERS